MLYPLPVVMVSCGDCPENYNIITVAWTGILCSDPPMCYISVRKERHSHPIISKNREFVINLTTEALAKATDWCGVRSGKDYNKFKEMHLRTYFHYKNDTTTYISFLGSASTPEVLQTTKVTNDKEALRHLVDDESCTYLKSPSGIFTEVTLPVDEITQNHANDSLLMVSITFQRENSNVSNPYLLDAPSTVIMLPTDSLRTFFEEEKSYDYNSSFVETLSKNCYEFSNISNLITLMSKNKAKGLASDPDWVSKHPNWNKVLLVPISVTTSTTSSGTTVAAVISNQMGLVSTKLVGGPNNPIEMKVIYAKFKDN